MAQPGLRLLLACARPRGSTTDCAAIRRMLEEGIDWTILARQAINHDVASLIGTTMEQAAPDMVPAELLDALQASRDYIRSRNGAICEGWRRTAAALMNCGIDAIWFKGPVLGIRAYGGRDLRVFGAPTLLIREAAAPATIAALLSIGYRQKAQLTQAQLRLIHRLEGHEILSNESLGIGADVYTRLTPIRLALDIDHEGLWRRAQSQTMLQQTVQTLAPEDQVLASSIHDGNGFWRLAEVCDFAGLIASQPDLDWPATVERARAQGCQRMLAFALSLACNCFDAAIADEILRAERADPIVKAMVARTVAHWQVDEPAESPCDLGFSTKLFRLHDGGIRKARYVVRSLSLPAPPHVSRIALPRGLTNPFVYALVKVVQDAAMVPLVRTYRGLRSLARRLRDRLASHEVGLALISLTSEQRLVLRRHSAARATAERAVAENPNDAGAWQALGDSLTGLGRHRAAITAYDKALEHAPEDLLLWRKRSAVIRAGGGGMSRFDTEEAATLNPSSADAWARHAASLAAVKRFAEAVSAADRALAIDPGHVVATRVGIRARIVSCDWRRSRDDERRVADAYEAGLALLTPAGNRAICDSEGQNLIAAQLWAKPFELPRASASLPAAGKYLHDRIRLAYLCSEYQDHPVGRQIVGVLEHHDRSRFETTAISLGGPNSSAIRQRIQAASDKFISVHEMSDGEAARLVRDMEIDIAIDLDRFAARARPGILARRPAALQVTYFGNAGTTGAPFLDYIVADRTLIPPEQFRHYTEKVIYLPTSYQCNDSKRRLTQSEASRAEAGLPEAGVVYCCFNQHYKIRPAVFDVWMRLLRACPGSVLWLLGGEPFAMHNLRREAAVRGIESDRIVFAPKVPNEDHIARQKLADLFLDTLPCNAHATASDALWAGLPVLTCLGNTFAGRVGASLLRAVGLPELVTESLPEYEASALSLARDPERLGAVKTRLAQNRFSQPLFDTAGFTRGLEAAFETIWRRQQAGLAPGAIAL